MSHTNSGKGKDRKTATRRTPLEQLGYTAAQMRRVRENAERPDPSIRFNGFIATLVRLPD